MALPPNAIKAGVTEKLVRDFQHALQDCLENGETFRTFLKSFDTIVKKHDWTYQGETEARAELIYNLNTFAFYDQRRHKQMTESMALELYPFWRYRCGPCIPPCNHDQWEGILLPTAHPWWSSHFPANNRYCHCHVEVISIGKMEREKLTVSPVPGEGLQTATDPLTGEVIRVPAGVEAGFEDSPAHPGKLKRILLLSLVLPLPAG
ncbi:hypothetical protein E3E12_06120 [Formicincola oecophyllae]|uniref:Uncharacterized protein n=1 Tax=Formicincola oecophyllae TaxID=2558361 RepID=A0A4Y6UA49_9PROT|nr:phage minor head protein [Formicincola oecophyllae]QDH13830.1 hypothetical protein E3E12_06120 [Formicincola oecophyllae]